MRWSDRRILVTGASGGIGRELVTLLAERGAWLLIVGRNENMLKELTALAPGHIRALSADLTQPNDRRQIVEMAEDGRVDMLINAAGLNHFGLFDEQSPAVISSMVDLNVTATLLLTQALLPRLLHENSAWIVNLGSAFGAIGHPGYTAYCTTKFALRGFSQALRRELADTPVRVLHISPRATRTDMNSAHADALNTAQGNHVDDPAQVAAGVIRGIEKHAPDRQLGWPECLLVKLNGILPGLVDRALKKQLSTIQQYARRSSTSS